MSTGGAICFESASGTIEKCIFINNHSGNKGSSLSDSFISFSHHDETAVKPTIIFKDNIIKQDLAGIEGKRVVLIRLVDTNYFNLYFQRNTMYINDPPPNYYIFCNLFPIVS